MMLIFSFAILSFILLSIVCTFAYKLSSNLNRFTPLATQVFNEEIVVLRDGISNVYLIKGTDGYIAVDAGRNIRQLKIALESVKIETDEIRAVLLTHSDPDHINGISIFGRAIIYLPKKEEELATGIISRAFGILINRIKTPYITIDDGDKIELLGRLINTRSFPGHTPGSTAYIIDDKYLFTGDILELQGKRAVSFPAFFNMDDALNQINCLKVKDILNYEYMFTGHSGVISKKAITWE